MNPYPRNIRTAPRPLTSPPTTQRERANDMLAQILSKIDKVKALREFLSSESSAELRVNGFDVPLTRQLATEAVTNEITALEQGIEGVLYELNHLLYS